MNPDRLRELVAMVKARGVADMLVELAAMKPAQLRGTYEDCGADSALDWLLALRFVERGWVRARIPTLRVTARGRAVAKALKERDAHAKS